MRRLMLLVLLGCGGGSPYATVPKAGEPCDFSPGAVIAFCTRTGFLSCEVREFVGTWRESTCANSCSIDSKNIIDCK